MRKFIFCSIRCFAVLLGAIAMPGMAFSQDGARWLLQTSIYTAHYNSDPAHNDNQKLINLEYQRPDSVVMGAAAFDNSFGQPSQYVYFGKLWRPLESAPLMHVKLTGGLLHGYKDQYRDKIPFNGSGVAPAIIPMVGLSGKHVSGEFVLLGSAGIMVAVGVLF